jgi:hypothetical protein
MGSQEALLGVIHDGRGLLEAQNISSIACTDHFGVIGVSVILWGVHLFDRCIFSIFNKRASKRNRRRGKPLFRSVFWLIK